MTQTFLWKQISFPPPLWGRSPHAEYGNPVRKESRPSLGGRLHAYAFIIEIFPPVSSPDHPMPIEVRDCLSRPQEGDRSAEEVID